MAENPVYTFNANFNEFLPEYRDVTRVWIGDGSNQTNQKAGMLYAQYVDNRIQELGYVTLYDYAHEHGYQGTAAEWTAGVIELVAMNKGATVSITYQTTTDGTNHPAESSAAWSPTPAPEKGKFIWTKIVLQWIDSTTSTIYTVAYQGADSDLTSVNGLTGDAVLHGENIMVSASSQETLKHYIDNQSFTPTVATNAQIDALFVTN